jgi:hypothetical protein
VGVAAIISIITQDKIGPWRNHFWRSLIMRWFPDVRFVQSLIVDVDLAITYLYLLARQPNYTFYQGIAAVFGSKDYYITAPWTAKDEAAGSPQTRGVADIE